MGETRLEKYKKYRQSLQEFKAVSNEPDSLKERESKIVSDKMNTTSTLPLEEVLGKIEESKDDSPRRVITRQTVTIAILCFVGLLLVAGLTVLGIYAFGGF